MILPHPTQVEQILFVKSSPISYRVGHVLRLFLDQYRRQSYYPKPFRDHIDMFLSFVSRYHKTQFCSETYFLWYVSLVTSLLTGTTRSSESDLRYDVSDLVDLFSQFCLNTDLSEEDWYRMLYCVDTASLCGISSYHYTTLCALLTEYLDHPTGSLFYSIQLEVTLFIKGYDLYGNKTKARISEYARTLPYPKRTQNLGSRIWSFAAGCICPDGHVSG